MSAAATPRVLRFDEARDWVLAAATPLPAIELPLARCAGRALRRRMIAPHALPPFRNSAMDGWAVRVADLAGASVAAPVALPVAGVVAAGVGEGAALPPGCAVRIMTGAPLPEGADAVVPFEQGEDAAGGARVRVGVAPAPGEHVREAGADVAAGALVLEAGRSLSAHDIALLAALGVAEVAVGPPPRVAILSTGDELLELGEPLRPGAIRDSNRTMLALLVAEAGGEVSIAERVPDDPARLATRVDDALALADVVVTIGGVSAGDFDPVKQALASLDGVELWRVEMRPGRPQAFGRPSGRLFFGLPGNPASVACVFEAMVRPALRRLQGHAALERPRAPVRLARHLASRAGRTDLVRCTLEWRDGELWASPAGEQISGHLLPQSRAHALVLVPEAAAELCEGDTAEAWVLRMPEGTTAGR
ncbi:MAG TPA: gephyrin-like molybdotransferase Glp [Candidatus Acidoferrales bacterium]|nr:gephyrin-like molybdotransferase Glp [Candidatus Acidoferrales bacterium]